jgi:hypothetical protein
LAAATLLAGEYFFPQMSSVKTRRHYVLGDLAFSGKCSDQSRICFTDLLVFVIQDSGLSFMESVSFTLPVSGPKPIAHLQLRLLATI